jgi:glutaredoxin
MKLDEALNQTNIIIYFFMIGCPHCEKTKPVWDQFKKEDPEYKYVEIESADVPDEKKSELGIEGFPHFLKIDSKGKKKSVSGSKSTVQELKNAFKLFGGRRSRRFRRRVRKTLRRRRA